MTLSANMQTWWFPVLAMKSRLCLQASLWWEKADSISSISLFLALLVKGEKNSVMIASKADRDILSKVDHRFFSGKRLHFEVS